jgi:hypothetical protein
MGFAGLVTLEQLTEHGALQMLHLGERHDPDPYERLSHVATVRVLSGLAAGAAVAALGKHGFSFYHAVHKAAKHPRHVYTGAWALTGGFLGLNATPLIESVTRSAMKGWNEALGTPPPAIPTQPHEFDRQLAGTSDRASVGGGGSAGDDSNRR